MLVLGREGDHLLAVTHCWINNENIEESNRGKQAEAALA